MTELDTFVKKFPQLWKDGVTAHLYLDTHAGWACVYGLDRSLVLFIGKFILFTKKFLERKALPVSDAVLGEQLLDRQVWIEQRIQKLWKPRTDSSR